MTERFSFAVPDTNIIWNQEIDVNTSLNEHYVTAIDETQYLSVLDGTNDITLEDLTLAGAKLDVGDGTQDFIQGAATNGEDVTNGEEASESEVVVYSVDGSDELFGIQTARDEEGNFHKYQFQFRRNEDGQLEAIPETIQLLPNDDEVLRDALEATEDDNQMQIFVTGDEGMISHGEAFAESEEAFEHNCRSEVFDDNVVEETEAEVQQEEEIDVKPLISSVKEEIQVEYDSLSQIAEQELAAEAEINEEYERNMMENNISFADQEDSTIKRDIHFMESYQPEIPEENEDSIEHVEVNPDLDLIHEHQEHSDGENEEFDIVEGLHITADTASAFNNETLDKNANCNILRQALKMNQQQNKKDGNPLIFYLIQKPEKENVDSLSLDMANLCRPKINPRSILKSSHGMLHPQNEYDQYQNKRFFKCKEAQQARSFHSYINKTTIPQAPVRKDRLPRKQKILPVERQDEEIVVQEVMVGSNGFVENINKEDLAVLDYVNLADSDEEYDPKRNGIRKKKHRRKRTITISDSEDSEENSVIDLIESEEEDEGDDEDVIISTFSSTTTATKRRRGRPPKNPIDTLSKKLLISDNHLSSKKHKGSEEDVPISKPEIPCPKCEKTFPSQNSLKTHLQHHNLQNSLNKAALPFVWKYKCKQCGETFKNQILEQRHKCPTIKTTCTICFKKLASIDALNIHKRIHLKDHMVKTTTNILELSTKKISRKTNIPTIKAQEKINSLKCRVCGKVCSSTATLNVHVKTHKECATCLRLFVSNLMLERHLLENCVKSPKRQAAPETGTKPRFVRAICEQCNAPFGTIKALFQHKVSSHGLPTPDKESVLKNGKEERKFTGIPASARLQKAFSAVKRQTQLF